MNKIKDVDIDEDIKNEILITKFMDEDDLKNNKSKKEKTKEKNIILVSHRPLTDLIFANVNTTTFKSWSDFFGDSKVVLKSLMINNRWKDFFNIVSSKPYYTNMNKIFTELVESNNVIVPYPELVFNAFNLLSLEKIKVVFIGQDPYPGSEIIKKKIVPQAMGLCFSVPLNYPKPDSLRNIYNNLLEHKHIREIPESGCLYSWVLQGCFMINATFTTILTKKNIHKNIWKDFTLDLINYLNNKLNNIVFVAWGTFALDLCKNINTNKHCIIASSHPSPLAYHKTVEGYMCGPVKSEANRKKIIYPAFRDVDHFGKINEYLISVDKKSIKWNIY